MRHFFLTAASLILAVGISAGDTYTVYLSAEGEVADAERLLEPLMRAVPDATCNFVHLKSKCSNMHEAVQAAKAIRAGVTHLPSLVLADEAGEYATVPLALLTDESLSAAQAEAGQENREEQYGLRCYHARQYLLFARLGLAKPLSDEEIELCLASCRILMNNRFSTVRDRQFLGFRCLYPLLMLQYANGYKGAHTPATEAKLLEAIAALEAARDLDVESDIGKAAFAERERLRTARRKARQYE